MDIQTLAQQIVPFLAPFLPYLVKAGEKATEEAGKKLGEGAWESAKAVWAKLHPKVEAKPAAQEAVQDVAQNPEDPDALAALRLQLRKILRDDPTLAAEVASLVQQATAGGNIASASGDRSVAIGGDVSDSTIITGDRNVAQQPPETTRRGIVMIPVESSMVEAVGYDAQHRRLQVLFTSGRAYCYEQVPPDVFQGLLEAESKGRYMRAFILDAYPYHRGPCSR